MWLPTAIVITLVAVTCLAFWPGLHGAFLNWDDDRNFVENLSYRGLGLDQARWAWQTYHLGVWQPASWILLGLEYEIGGSDPAVHHGFSLGLHAINAVVFYLLGVAILRAAHRTTDRAGEQPGRASWSGVHLAAAAAALLFAAHPLRVEAVAWISCQPYLIAALFYMLAVLAYVLGHGRPIGSTDLARPPCSRRPCGPRWGCLGVTFACFLLAAGAKAVAVTLPAVLLILDVYPLRRWGGRHGWVGRAGRRVCIEKLPFFVVAVVVSVWAAAAKDASASRVPFSAFDADARLAQAATGVAFYLSKTIVPTDLIPYARLPADLGLLTWRYGLNALFVVAATIGLLLARRRWPAAPAAWVAYVIILLPNLGIVQISRQVATDRYSYVAILPVMLLFAGALLKLWRLKRTNRRALRVVVCLGVLGAAAGLTRASRRQVDIWRDSQRLWQATLDVDPDCAVAECNLGVALLEAGDPVQASQHISRAIDLRSDFSFAYANLGIILLRAERFDDAVLCFERALALKSNLATRDLAKIHAGLGEVYAAQRRDHLAWKHTRKAQALGYKDASKMIDYLRRFSAEPQHED